MIVTGLVNTIKQVGADAMMPSAAVLKMVLIGVSATRTYDKTYSTSYVAGMNGDEVPSGNGYIQNGQVLSGRTSGPTDPYGWVKYNDVVWTANGQLSAIGALIYDATNGNRIVGFIDFGGTKSATDATFTVQLPADSGPGVVRIS
jgi:hypothetical protein